VLEIAQVKQFAREEHANPDYTQPTIPEENEYVAIPDIQVKQLVSSKQVRQFATQFLEILMLLKLAASY